MPTARNPPTARSAHTVAIFAFDGVQSLDVTGPAEVFAGANQTLRQLGRPERYDVSIVSIRGGPVATESAVGLTTDPIDHGTRLDTLLVPGGFSVRHHQEDPELVAALTGLTARAARLVTVCSGALLAAATGALDGHRVTTHWARSAELAERHPAVTVDDDPIYVRSRNGSAGTTGNTGTTSAAAATDASRVGGHAEVWSSAGVTAGIDLSLALVEHDHSSDVAQNVARWLVMFLRRPGGQSQFATPTWVRQARPGPIQEAQQFVLDDPAGDHTVARLAAQVGLSERHFTRRFSAEIGMSPARYVAQIRTDAARHALETSNDTLEVIAARCGFGTAETLRRTLLRQIGVSPDAYRRRFSVSPPPPAAAPSGHHIDPFRSVHLTESSTP